MLGNGQLRSGYKAQSFLNTHTTYALKALETLAWLKASLMEAVFFSILESIGISPTSVCFRSIPGVKFLDDDEEKTNEISLGMILQVFVS